MLAIRVHLVFDVVSLASDRVGQDFVCFYDFLEVFGGLDFVSFTFMQTEIGMTLLCHFIVRQLDLFLFCRRLYVQYLIKRLLLFDKVKNEGSSRKFVEQLCLTSAIHKHFIKIIIYLEARI